MYDVLGGNFVIACRQFHGPSHVVDSSQHLPPSPVSIRKSSRLLDNCVAKVTDRECEAPAEPPGPAARQEPRTPGSGFDRAVVNNRSVSPRPTLQKMR